MIDSIRVNSSVVQANQTPAIVQQVSDLVAELAACQIPAYTDPPSAAWIRAYQEFTGVEEQIDKLFGVMGFQQEVEQMCKANGWTTQTLPYYGTLVEGVLGSANDFLQGNTPLQNTEGARDNVLGSLVNLLYEMTTKAP
jgi:hypothetical protein